MSLTTLAEIKKTERKLALEAIKEKLRPSAEEQAKQEHAAEFWSDPCWSEPLDSE